MAVVCHRRTLSFLLLTPLVVLLTKAAPSATYFNKDQIRLAMHIGYLIRFVKIQIPTPTDPTYCERLVKMANAYLAEVRKMNIQPPTLKRRYISTLRSIRADANMAHRNRDGETSCLSLIGAFTIKRYQH